MEAGRSSVEAAAAAAEAGEGDEGGGKKTVDGEAPAPGEDQEPLSKKPKLDHDKPAEEAQESQEEEPEAKKAKLKSGAAAEEEGDVD